MSGVFQAENREYNCLVVREYGMFKEGWILENIDGKRKVS